MPAGFTRGFAERLDRLTTLRTREARDGDVPLPGTVLVAPGNAHLELVRESGRIVARVTPRGHQDRYAPSVDRLFRSAARVCGAELLAVVLTGMGDDGREGVLAVKRAGGHVIAEAEETAVVFGMPKQAIRTGAVDAVLPLDAIGPVLRGAETPGQPSGLPPTQPPGAARVPVR
jgi:two-component system chemotaxis response regulator CheB